MLNADKKLTNNRSKLGTETSLQLIPLIMQNIPQAIFWKDQNLVYLGCNQAFAEDAGFASPEEVIGKTDFDMPWKDQAEAYRADDRRVLDSGEAKLNYEEPQTTPAGATTWLRTSKIPVCENGRVVAILGMYEDITERKQAELAILFRDRALASSLNAVIILDMRDNKPIYANESLLRMTGYTFAEIQQLTLADITGSVAELPKIRAAVEKQGFFVGEELIKRKDGSVFPATFFTSLIKDANGQPIAIQSSFLDISELKQAENLQQQSERMFQALFEMSPDAVTLIDPYDPSNEWPIVDCNTAACQINGYTRAELIGQPINIVNAPTDTPIERTEYLKRLHAEGTVKYEVLHRRKDGTIFPVEVYTTLIQVGERKLLLGMDRDITERKQVEQALRDSEAMYSAVVTKAKDGVVIIQDGKVQFINQAMAEMVGYAPAEMINTPMVDYIAPESKELLSKRMNARLAGEDVPSTYEARLQHKNGMSLDAELSANVIEYQGKPADVVIIRNITERKRTEVDLLLRERALASSHNAVIITSLDSKIVYVNEAFLKMSGYTHEEALQLSPASLASSAEYVQMIQEKIQTQGFFEGENVFERKDGTVFPTDFFVSPIFNAEGRPIATLATVRDISERKQAERALAENEERFKRFTEATLEGLVFHELGKVIDANPSAISMFGFSATEEAIGRNLLEFIVPEYHPLVLKQMQLGTVAPYEIQCIRLDGTRFPVETATRAYQLGERTLRATSLRDITERKRVEDALKTHDEFSQKQSSVFAELARSQALYSGDIQAAFAEVTETSAKTLNVERVSIWYYNQNHTEIRCMDLFEQGKGHSEGTVLSQTDFPAYFKALVEERVIAAANAHEDPATHEFSKSYLTPLGINSMLDAPIRLRGEVIGVICHEHIGPIRQWTVEEQNFARTIVDFVTVAVETQERKQVERALRESQKFLQIVMDNIPQSIFWKDSNLTYLGCNSAFAADAGFASPEDIIGKTDWDMPWKDQAEAYRADDGLVMKNGVPKLNYEEPQTTPDGRTSWLRTSKIPLYDVDGNAFAVLGMYEDITERKQAEKLLQQSETNMLAALQVANMGHWEYDIDTQTFTLNDQYYSLHGLTAREVGGYQISLQRFAQEFVYPEDAPTVGQATQQAIETTDPDFHVQTESRILHTDGKPRWVTVWFRVEKDAQGRTIKLHGVSQDITARKQLEEGLLMRNRALASSLSAVLVIGLDFKPIYVNESFLKMTGYTYEEAMRLTITDLSAYPEELKRIDEATHAQGFFIGEEALKRKDGSIFPTDFSTSYIVDATGKPIAIQTTFIDITERKSLEAQVREAFDRRGLQVQLSTQVSQSIAAASSLPELYDRVVTQIKEQFGYYHTQLLRYDPAQEAIVLVVGYGEVGRQMLADGHRMPMGEGLIGTAAATGETILRTVLTHDLDWQPNPLLPETKGEIAVPIKMGDTILGVLDVQSNEAGSLDADDQLLLEGLCGQIATAIESTRLRQEMVDRLEEINRLYRAMSHEGWQTYRQTANLPTSFLYDQAGLRPAQEDDLTKELFSNVPLAIPGGEVIGTLAVADDAQHPLTPDDETFLLQVSEQLALALESARLFEQTQSALSEVERRASELETVAKLSATTASVLDPDQLLETVVELTQERFGLYHAHIYVYDEAWNTLLLAAGAGEVGRKLVAEQHAIPLSVEQSLVTRAARERRAIIVNNVNSEPDFLPNPLLPETCAELAVPMVAGDKLLGVFDVQSNNPAGFTVEDANIYVTLATQVAVALQNARLYVEQAALVTQLRELDRLKSSFLANMSHELRTPLNSILGFADVIIEELDGPLTENMANDLRLIQKNGQHLLHLINDVLDMAKIEAGRMNLNPEKFTACEVLEEVTSITSTLASEKNLALFITEDTDREVKVFADRTRLRQVMINLVNNAIKFTETGKISLKVAALEGARILITVKDTGLGIPADKLEAVFQEFTQVDSSSTRKAGGTGLGLPISRKLVEMHGGRLWAESSGIPGEGSTFFVELPVEARITETVEKQAK